jgi:hypothetical protein
LAWVEPEGRESGVKDIARVIVETLSQMHVVEPWESLEDYLKRQTKVVSNLLASGTGQRSGGSR